MILLRGRIFKNKTMNKQNRNRLTDTENKPMVSKEEWSKRMGGKGEGESEVQISSCKISKSRGPKVGPGEYSPSYRNDVYNAR